MITLLGNGIGPSQPVVGLVGGEASVPTSLGGVSVTFDDRTAPILYASATQINVQVPYEVKQKATSLQPTVMQVSYNGAVLETRSFAVAAANPSLFLGSGSVACGNGNYLPEGSSAGLAINADGSVNSCANPAHAGSVFTVFVNGIGVFANNETTGSLSGSNPGFDTASVGVFGGYFGDYSIEVYAFTDMANTISGVGQITARVPDSITTLQTMGVSLTLENLLAGPFTPGFAVGVSAQSASVGVFVAP